MVRYSYRPIQVRIDGVSCEAGSVVVSKGSLYAGNFLLAPDARPGERGFSVALFGGTGPFAAAKFGAALVLNLLPRAPGMRLLRASRVEIEGDSDMKAQADGDPAGAAPLVVRDSETPISVVIS
jgi:diacylglycerol kinase family enzyme